MKVKIVKTRRVVDYDESYAARLIEQGRAVLVKEEPFMNEPEPAAEQEPEEAKPKSGAKGKGK